jgi:hypothetical protein
MFLFLDLDLDRYLSRRDEEAESSSPLKDAYESDRLMTWRGRVALPCVIVS